MSAAAVPYLPQDQQFWTMYANNSTVEPSAPQMDPFDQICYFLMGRIQYEWPQDELDQMTKWMKQITGYKMSALLDADRDIPNLIQTLQLRESGLVRMYQHHTDGHPTSRATLMDFHAKFFSEYGVRIIDFQTDQSFFFVVENHIQAQFA